MINGETSIYGILGCPVRSSLSPKMHNAAFAYHKLNSVYVPLLVESGGQNSIIKAFNTLNIKGANITVPYKSSLFEQLDSIDPYAKKINSINTLIKTNQGWAGFSTDGVGFIQALTELKIDIANTSFLMIGAGGAGKAIAFALCEAGAQRLYIKNRTTSKADELIDNLRGNSWLVDRYSPTNNNFQVLINTTSVGMDATSLSADDEMIRKAKVVIDIIYSPEMTPLLVKAKAAGKIIQNGLPMLINQARESFYIWTGKMISSEVLRKAILH
ncbi:MAG: shikimate dehydrogenase [SAR324 cluster bacterium]|nr:shikimate dehydrogenase [SAR324 cluster bacterium]